ncbi:MAG: hypothetical protein AB7O37_16380 [Vicinamibacteria bacterium]
MSPLALALLRRAAAYALLLAVLLAVVPRLLGFLGWIGPSLDEEIAGVERSLAAAQTYGAEETEANYAQARATLAAARELQRRGERFQAKRRLAEARSAALSAQRVALTSREQSRRAAQKVVAETDRRMNELEDLYGQVTRDLDKPTVSRLFSRMKATRQKAAALWLNFEQQSYGRVLADERAVIEALDAARLELRAAQAGRQPAPAR